MAEFPPVNDVCCVCHGRFNIPFQANCSHWFCGNCILLVWDHGSALQPCKCPLCRRQITLLVPAEASQRESDDPEVARIVGRIEQYNRMFGRRENSLFQRMQDLPFFLRRLLRELMDPQRSLPLVIKARVYFAITIFVPIEGVLPLPSLLRILITLFVQMLVSILYIVSPVDIIPEAILGVLGLLDDLIIAFICFLHVATIYRSVLVHRHGGT